ncbi:MAG: hypothetical protein KL787_07350 [Taibaiella sp.]|nr:hypothetical protein [Taibaiella sp.]
MNPQNAVNISDKGPFNNIGVPGIRCLDFGTPYYALVKSLLQKICEQH